MTTLFEPQDQDARIRIREALDESLFVEAGAGTGKTSSLVDRLLALVSSGRTTLDRVAAITFTEAAAAELRDRVREALEQANADQARDEVERARCGQGVADLDRASIQTLHSFAGSLLRERPLEAGLPPAFETRDQIAADLAFQEAWASWLDQALDDPDLQPALRPALALGLGLGHLRQLARSFHNNYDLLETADFPDRPFPVVRAVTDLVAAMPELERLVTCSRAGDGDPLVAHVRAVIGVGRRLQELDRASVTAWRLLDQSLPLRTNRGNQRNWETDPVSGANAAAALKAMLSQLDQQVRDELSELREWCLLPLLRAARKFVLGYAEQRKRRGQAEFMDLLVWARDLLRDNLVARDHFRERFSHILVDEAQDTDPIQAEIATFLAEEVAPGTPPGARPRQWTQVRPAPGKLFVVGDPKQSIYRFRRADGAVLARFRALLTETPINLSQNFRSQRAVVAWVNHLFQQLLDGAEGQAAYAPIRHRWEPNTDHPRPPSVWRLGGPLEERYVSQVRRQESEAIAAQVRSIKAEEWPVLDREATATEGAERFRPAQFKDICILMPQRSALRSLELALEDADVPYRLEGASLVFATQEVKDLLNCLRAVDDPADQVALVASLRSPALACSDADLLSFVEGGGRFDFLAEDNPDEGPVAEGLAVLRRYHQRRLWTSPAALAEELLRERQLFQVALDSPRTRERWRRYAFLVGQARAFAESGDNSLRAFLEWVTDQAEEGARVTEVPVPETDEDAIRVMTVHGAKGLEFPVVLLTGLNFEPPSRRDSVLFDREQGSVEVRLGAGDAAFQTPGYETLAQLEAQRALAEDVRLLYVATTRARDHLVVSMYRQTRDQKSRAALLARHLEDADGLWHPIAPEAVPPPEVASETLGPVVADTPEHRQDWIEKREQLLQAGTRSATVAATALAQVVKEDAGLAEEPWRRGRAGTSLGRAIHAVLQTVDLSTGQGLADIVRAQAAAEGMPHRQAEIARLARVALESDTVRRAVAAGRWWREVPVAAPVGNTVLEGFIDLLFEEAGGLVVVDYKTDILESDAKLAERTAHYRVQAGAYAWALQVATGLPVREVVLLFLQPRQEMALGDVSELLSEVADALATRQVAGLAPGPVDPNGE